MAEPIEVLESHIKALEIGRLTSLAGILKHYVRPLEGISQQSSHHKGESTLEHVLLVVESLARALLVIKRLSSAESRYLDKYPGLENEIVSSLSADMKARLHKYLKDEMDGKPKEELLFYAALLHDSGKLDLMRRYEKDFGKFSHFSKHHIFGSLIVNYYDDCVRDVEEYRKDLEKRAAASGGGKFADEIAYLGLLERFLRENKDVLESMSFTRKQLNFISRLIQHHHEFSGPFNEFKGTGKVPKATRKVIKSLKQEGILEGELLLFYADVMSCLGLFGHEELKKKLVAFIVSSLEIAG
jgi:hypothetical protein